MSKRTAWLLVTFFLGFIPSLMLWWALGLSAHHVPYTYSIALTAAVWSPFVVTTAVIAGLALHWQLRRPDVVIVVSDPPTPLEAKFQEQDRRLERRERLKGEVFKNECEIETFAANLTPDERKAWLNRPGPYGK